MDGVVHIEVPTMDLDGSKAFYESVFGWEVMPCEGGPVLNEV